jgi:ParB family chromosome partitioning protein
MMALDLSALDAPIVAIALTPPTAPLSRFEEDPDNPRTEFAEDPDFEALVEDVRLRGILQPIVVRSIDGTERLRIRFGARRYRAALRAGLAEIPYFVTDDERQFDDYAQIAENERRQALQPLDLAKFVAKRIAMGDKKLHISKQLRLDHSAITHLLALVEGPAFLLELYHSHKCRTPKYLWELARLYTKDAELVERRVAAVEIVDRAFIAALAGELEPSKSVAPSHTPHTKDVLDRAGGGAGKRSAPAPAAPERQSTAAAIDPSRIRNPLLLGSYHDRTVIVLWSQRPTVPGHAFVRFEDGSGDEEVSLGDIRLSHLTDAVAS